MGFFDSLANLNPEQTQGLLAAAAQTLQQSGPSRMPTSFGQILGGSIGGYQQGADAYRKRKQEEEQAAQLAQLRGLQIQTQTGELAQHGILRDQQAAIDAAAQGSVTDGKFDQDSFLQRLNSINPLKALEFQKLLAKAGPEFDTKPQTAIGEDGKPFQYIIAKNGQVQRLDGILPRDELKLANLGGKDVAYNPFALQPGQTFQRTQTPDSAAQVAATIRGQNLTDARGMESNQIARERLSSDKAPTEFQGKSAAFGLRAREADKILTQLAAAGPTGLGLVASDRPGALKAAAGSVPLIGNSLAAGVNTLPTWAGGPNANQQKAEQAQRDFVNAVLRQESGAAIGETEFQNARQQYFPQPGDGPEVIAQKANNRQLAIQGFEANAGRAKLTAPAAPGSGWSIQRVD